MRSCRLASAPWLQRPNALLLCYASGCTRHVQFRPDQCLNFSSAAAFPPRLGAASASFYGLCSRRPKSQLWPLLLLPPPLAAARTFIAHFLLPAKGSTHFGLQLQHVLLVMCTPDLRVIRSKDCNDSATFKVHLSTSFCATALSGLYKCWHRIQCYCLWCIPRNGVVQLTSTLQHSALQDCTVDFATLYVASLLNYRLPIRWQAGPSCRGVYRLVAVCHVCRIMAREPPVESAFVDCVSGGQRTHAG